MIKVLVIEDDPMVADLNKKFVQSIPGFHIVGHVTNGEDAYKFCKENTIDLAILDVYMPKMNGMEFLRILRSEFSGIDVILVTASKDVDTIETALSLGAIDYLIKPFQYSRFRQAMLKYVRRKELLNGDNLISQETIDLLTYDNVSKDGASLAKGLHKNTLERIIRYFKQSDNYVFTSDELSKDLDVSKVTVRRYMEYLETVGKVNIEIQYGTIGRPSYLYNYLASDK